MVVAIKEEKDRGQRIEGRQHQVVVLTSADLTGAVMRKTLKIKALFLLSPLSTEHVGRPHVLKYIS